MLSELSIKNFAIIDDLSISFSEGLTVLSGETGAGKSIIINAVNLLLGGRATSRLVRTGAENAELEAFFRIRLKTPAAEVMETLGFNPSDGLLIRRVISINDRHRIYINGRMGTIQMLTSITENLASISGQHAHQGLLKEEMHLYFLDRFAGLMPLRNRLYEKYHEIRPAIAELKRKKAEKARQAEQVELLEFQKREIEEAAISPGEDESLEKKRGRLRHGEELYHMTEKGIQELYSMDGAIAERLVSLKKNLEKACRLDSGLEKVAENLEDLVFRIEDVTATLRDYQDQISVDDRLLEQTEERLDLLLKLKRKYGGGDGTLEDVFRRYENIVRELSEIENLSDKIETLEKKLKREHAALAGIAEELSEKRKKAAKELAGNVEGELASLEMTGTRFEVAFEHGALPGETDPYLVSDGKTISETGLDRPLFMISPNVGEEIRPLARIASGGELSRVVLALKAILAEIDSVETVVFDEVDSGIGGGIAEVVGRKILKLAGYHQVICITHLPQIAKFGDYHYKIEKQVVGGRTSTTITPLSREDRIRELARMLGGVEITEKTLAHAREMLETGGAAIIESTRSESVSRDQAF